jgi:hypothetical protein
VSSIIVRLPSRDVIGGGRANLEEVTCVTEIENNLREEVKVADEKPITVVYRATASADRIGNLAGAAKRQEGDNPCHSAS